MEHNRLSVGLMWYFCWQVTFLLDVSVSGTGSFSGLGKTKRLCEFSAKVHPLKPQAKKSVKSRNSNLHVC